MSKRLPRMTLEEHIEHAKTVREMRDNLQNMRSLYGERFGFSNSLHKTANRMTLLLDQIRSELDNEYHKLASSEVFHEHGHIYYEGKRL